MAIDGGIFNPSQKSHRTRQSGPSAKKNKKKKSGSDNNVPNDKTHNPKVLNLILYIYVCVCVFCLCFF